jgi:hypothetical protein
MRKIFWGGVNAPPPVQCLALPYAALECDAVPRRITPDQTGPNQTLRHRAEQYGAGSNLTRELFRCLY